MSLVCAGTSGKPADQHRRAAYQRHHNPIDTQPAPPWSCSTSGSTAPRWLCRQPLYFVPCLPPFVHLSPLRVSVVAPIWAVVYVCVVRSLCSQQPRKILATTVRSCHLVAERHQQRIPTRQRPLEWKWPAVPFRCGFDVSAGATPRGRLQLVPITGGFTR
jgi:hypothetical protein